jgi:hypothetical protein
MVPGPRKSYSHTIVRAIDFPTSSPSLNKAMKSRTVSVFIAAPSEAVYAYASNPENLPRWVPSFFESVERVDGEWVARSPLGRVGFGFVHDNDLGVLDHSVTLPDGARVVNPMRVIPNGDGSEILFTLFQREGMTEQQFQEDADLVLNDLRSLKALLEPPAARPQ